VESYPTIPNTQSEIQFIVRNTSNVDIRPLLILPSVIQGSVPLQLNGGVGNGYVQARNYTFYDVNTNANALDGSIYYSNATGMTLEAFTSNSQFAFFTQNGVGGNTQSLTVNSINITTNTPTIPSTADASNKIPTTQWVQNVLSAYIPPVPSNTIKRAWKSGNFTGGGGNSASDIFISDCGTSSTIWQQNETLTLRVSLHQQWANSATSPTESTLYQTVYANVILYPWRFTTNWLAIGGGPQGAPRGEINQNGIYATTGLTTVFAPQDATYLPNGRQFWCDQIQWGYNGSAPTGRLYICGISGNLNAVRFIVANPYGYDTVPSGDSGTYSFNFSVELLNPTETTATITSTGFNVNF
jgi:hypothetical protein